MAADVAACLQVLVIGDAMLDTYHFGESVRLSPEAPVPVVRVARTLESPGGAANVASNLIHLGVAAGLIAACGDDDEGRRLAALLAGLRVDTHLARCDRPTTRKLRAVVGHRQVARLDFETVAALPPLVEDELIAEIAHRGARASAIVISDYGKGVCTERVCQAAIAAARARAVPMIVDPKGGSWGKYAGATVVTPNLAELGEVLGERIANEDATVACAAAEARVRFGFEQLIVTRAERGMTLATPAGVTHFPTEATEVFDVTGAGDTAVAAIAATLARTPDTPAAVRFANRAASLSVRRIGTTPVSLEEVESSLPGTGKVIAEAELLRRLASLRASGRKVVFTNGCFDLLHRGHVALLQRARELGDLLVVGINDDGSVRALKGPGRPINSLKDRAAVLAALACVDFVVAFEDETPHRLLAALRPDVLVKGGDYRVDQVIGREFAGATVVVPFEEGFSSTALLNRLGEPP